MPLDISGGRLQLTSSDGRTLIDSDGQHLIQLETVSGSFSTTYWGGTTTSNSGTIRNQVNYNLGSVNASANVVQGQFRITSKEGVADGDYYFVTGTLNSANLVAGSRVHPTTQFPTGDRVYKVAPVWPPINEWVTASGPALIQTVGTAIGGPGTWIGAHFHILQFYASGGTLYMRESFCELERGITRAGGAGFSSIFSTAMTIEYRLWLGALI